jgi:hypothetical protein
MKPKSNPIPPKPAPKPREQERSTAVTARIRELVRKYWGWA